MRIDRRKLLRNGYWMMLPILLWNIVFTISLPPQYSPAIFWKDIPPLLAVCENFLRIVMFVMPAFLALRLLSKPHRLGLLLYLVGSTLYYSSWLALILAPNSAWSTSRLGFMAPAYTPLIWMIGLALSADEFYFPLRYRPVYYIAPAVLFTVFHCAHAALVYSRNFQIA